MSDEDHGSYCFCRKPTESSCPPRAKLCHCAWQRSCQDKKSSQHTIFFCTTKWSPWIKSPVDDMRSRNKKLTSKCNSTGSLGCSLRSLSWAGMVEAALWLQTKHFRLPFFFFSFFFSNVLATDLVHHTTQINQTQILFGFFSFLGDRDFLTLR